MSGKGTRNNASRSKKGCLTCRSRHIKCDEGKPTCVICRKAHLKCRQPGVIYSFVLFSAVDKINDKFGGPRSDGLDQSRSSPLAMCRQSKNASAANTTALVRSSLDRETQIVLPSPPSTSFVPALDQILFNATENSNFNSFKLLEDTVCTRQSRIALIDREAAFLLRTYEEGIGAWMDVFDSSLSYQHSLLTRVPSSPLLLYSTCALAARQLSLILDSQIWTPVAERYYGNSLGLLSMLLSDPTEDYEEAVVASILLSSYELLKSPNRQDYHQHFRGAKSLIEALCAYNSTKQLTKASFWIYARHEVGEALNLERPVMLDPKLWPKVELSKDKVSCPDVLCNDILRISCEVVHFVFGSNDKRHSRKWAKEWLCLHSDLDEWYLGAPGILMGNQYSEYGLRRYWFPRPAFASAMCFYHTSKMFLALYSPNQIPTTVEYGRDPESEVQFRAQEIIDIALSDLPDGVLVTMVQTMFHAAKHVNDYDRKREVIKRLEQIRLKTGFYTESKVQILKSYSGP